MINVRAHNATKTKPYSDVALARSLKRLEVVQARLKQGPQVRSPDKRSPPNRLGGPWVVPPPSKTQFLETLSPVVAKWARTAGLREVKQKHAVVSPLREHERRVEAENHYLQAHEASGKAWRDTSLACSPATATHPSQRRPPSVSPETCSILGILSIYGNNH